MSKRKVNTYKVSEQLPQRERIRKLMEVVDDLKGTSIKLDVLIEEVKKRHGTFDDLLEAVFDDAASSLEDRRIFRWENKVANFTLPKATFANFDFSFPKKIDITLINELRSYRFVNERKNVLIIGPIGVGKSHIACALGREAIEKGIYTLCMTLGDIMRDVNNTLDSTKAREQRIKNLIGVTLLILDDIEDTEKMGTFNQDAMDFLYTLVRKRYESNDSSTIFTFNESFKGWDNIFGSQERAKKLINRIIERRHVLTIEGESYREKLGNEGIFVSKNKNNNHVRTDLPGVLNAVTGTER